MKTSKMKIWIGCGIFCVLSILISSWYAVTFNDSRLARLMDFKNYTFDIRDLPILISVSATCVYLTALFVMLVIRKEKKQRQAEESGITRKVNPGLGWLGIAGFLGFIGFWTYSADGTVFPFAFFLFFGFFGFFYEGRMSGTFMDERFRENIVRARLRAYRITFLTMMAALVILALGIFLSEYLLYRYDHDDQADESNPSLKLAIDIARVVEVPIEEIFVFR